MLSRLRVVRKKWDARGSASLEKRKGRHPALVEENHRELFPSGGGDERLELFHEPGETFEIDLLGAVA